MKYLLACLVLFATFSAATSADLPQDLTALVEEYEPGMRIFGINDDDYEDDNDNKFFVLKLETQVNADKENPGYMVRVTVQLFEKKTDKWVFAQKTQKLNVVSKASRGTGQTTLEFEIPYGELKRPKMEACVIEIGLNKGGTFIPLTADYDGVDSADEIINGKGSKVKMDCTKNTGWYHGN